MSHFTRTQADGTWINGYTVLPGDFTSLESKVQAAVNGDDGGAWAPTSPIIIAGAGLKATAPIRVWGPSGALRTVTGGRFQFGDGDFAMLGPNHSGSARTIITHFATAAATHPDGGVNSAVFNPTVIRFDYGGSRQFLATSFWNPITTTVAGALPPRMVLPLRVHNGATITKATVTFRVGQPHAIPPPTPQVRIVRISASGVITPMTSVAAGADANGRVSPALPSSGLTWYSNGSLQTLVIPCDQNNVVNTDLYWYAAEVIEEGNISVAPFSVPAVTSVFAVSTTNVPLTSTPATIDGYTMAPNTSFLLVGQTNVAENGVYSPQVPLNTTPPVRSALSKTADFVQGGIVGVAFGTQYAGSMWQLTNPTNTTPVIVGTTPITFALAKDQTNAYGNIWHAVSLAMSNITDTRY